MKYLLGVVGLLAVGAAGLVLYLLFTGGGSAPAATTATDRAETEAVVAPEEDPLGGPASGSSTLLALLARGEALECTIDQAPAADTTVTGTYFVANGTIRGDFLVNSAGTEVLSSIILDQTTLYTWTELADTTYGMQVERAILEESAEAATDAPDPELPVALDETIFYECRPWPNVDRTIFVPPSDVQFQSYDTLIEQGMQYGTLYESLDQATTTPAVSLEGQSPCALCEQVPEGPGKTECLTRFSCTAASE